MQVLFIQTWEIVQFSKAVSFPIVLLTSFENYESHNISKTGFMHMANIEGVSRSHHIDMAMEKKGKDPASSRRSHNQKLLHTSSFSI